MKTPARPRVLVAGPFSRNPVGMRGRMLSATRQAVTARMLPRIPVGLRLTGLPGRPGFPSEKSMSNDVLEHPEARAAAEVAEGEQHQRHGGLEPAIAHYTAAIALDARHHAAYLARGQAFRGRGELE